VAAGLIVCFILAVAVVGVSISLVRGSEDQPR
jgi:hypothetical protein